MKYSLLTIIVLFLFQPSCFAAEPTKFTAQQDQFIQLYSALKKGKSVDLAEMQDYKLYPFLAYEHLNNTLKTASITAISQFIHNNESTHLADQLWPKWLAKFRNAKQWEQLRDNYQEGRGGVAAKCYYLEAKLMLKEAIESTTKEAEDIWLSGSSRPNACGSLFDELANRELLTTEKVWQRIALAIEKGNKTLAKHLAKKLSKKDQQRVALWILFKHKAAQNIQKKNTLKLLSGNHDYDNRILLYGIKRLSRKNTKKAKNILQQFEKTHDFSVQEKAETLSYIAMQDALNHEPYALQHFSSIPDQYRDDDSNVWMARMALRQSDWKKVLNAIEAMSEEYQNKDSWKYWKARALSQQDQTEAALALYEEIAVDASFYGFLAADRLQADYVGLQVSEPDRSEQINDLIQNNAGIQRALELFNIGFRDLAKKEWFYTLKQLNNDEILATSKLALEKNLPFVAIVSVAKTKDWNQVGLRFPLHYQDLIKKYAGENEISPAWVYGVTRRESAFDANIVSSAKAKGLMQLIPPTAREVARKLDLPTLDKKDLFIPSKNIQLGSAYLKELLNKFDGNYVKASAAYNAGPYRIPRWLPDSELEASRWIESIPFSETRKYVRAVMAYTTIYDYKLNHQKGTNLRLSDRLASIGPAEPK